MKRSFIVLSMLAWLCLGGTAQAATYDDTAFTLSGKKVQRVENYTKFFTTGTATAQVSLPATVSYTFTLKGDLCGPDAPRAVLRVDGTQVASLNVDDQWKSYKVVQSLQGVHSFQVAFTNDYFEPRDAFTTSPPKPLSCDRNLYLDALVTDDAGGEPPPPPPPPPPTGDVLHRADAERPWDQDWAAYSCQSRDRFTQVTDPRNQGTQAYAISVRDGDNSYGERCELTLGNTSSSNITRVGGSSALFHRNQDVWIAGSWFLPTNYSFAPAGAPVGISGDGGLVEQLKQLGSCGTPALGIVATKTIFAVRNSAGNYCENATMRSLFKWPMVLGRWVKILQHVKFSTDRSVGFFELWVDGVSIAPSTGISGTTIVGNRIYTHTQKQPTDHPAACPSTDICSHGRVGIYRDPDVSGPSTVYVDGWNFASDRASAEAVAFP